MIGYYKVSAIGTDHLNKPGGVCQDYSEVKQTSDGFTIAVIADGLGSAKRSDLGSETAVKSAIGFISKNIGRNRTDGFYTDLLLKAYMYAYNSVIHHARDLSVKPEELNTTLAAAIYDGRTLYYGQCGDGGIIALTYDGDYVCVTEVKKGEAFNETFPLLGGESNWSFGKYEGEVCAVTMMTDGIFDIVCHPLLASETQKINIHFIRRFMDRNILKANIAADFESLQKGIGRFISGSGLPGVTDDKTIVGLINTEIMPKLKDDDYYREPDWDALNDKMKEKLRGSKVKKPEENTSRIIQTPEQSPSRDKELGELYEMREKYSRCKRRNKLLARIAITEFAVIVLLALLLGISASHKKTDKKAKASDSVSSSVEKTTKKTQESKAKSSNNKKTEGSGKDNVPETTSTEQSKAPESATTEQSIVPETTPAEQDAVPGTEFIFPGNETEVKV